MAVVKIGIFQRPEVDGFLALSQREYVTSVANNREHIQWKHLLSPFGASTYVTLSSSDSIIGRALIQPRPFLIASKRLPAGCVTDVIIDREHRSPPTNFISLMQESGRVKGFDLVFHTANEKTHPLYSKLLKFSNPFSMSAFGLPVRLAGPLARVFGRTYPFIDWCTTPARWMLMGLAAVVVRIAGMSISSGPLTDEELDELSRHCEEKAGPLFVRTNDYLKWRLSDCPLFPADIHRIAVYGKKVAGYVATSKIELQGLKHFVLRDFMLSPGLTLLQKAAIRLWLVRGAIVSGADTVYTMFNKNNASAKQLSGFPLMHIPDRLLPHMTPIYLRWTHDQPQYTKYDGLTHLTMSDLDYF